MHTRASRVKTANKFTRVGFACVAGDQPMKHPAFRHPDSIIEKLRQFHHVHKTPLDQVLADLKTAVQQLPYDTRRREAEVVAEVLRQHTQRRRGPGELGSFLPAVLARLEIQTREDNDNRVGPRPA